MGNDDIELFIRWSADTEELGNVVWCSKAAADAILRLAKQKERLESRIQKLEAVAEAARDLQDSAYYSGYFDLDKALAKLERE